MVPSTRAQKIQKKYSDLIRYRIDLRKEYSRLERTYESTLKEYDNIQAKLDRAYELIGTL